MAVIAEIQKDVGAGVGRITLDRPPANSYDPEFLAELDVAIGEVAGAGVPVAVVQSSSEKFFSAGADVKGFLSRTPDENNAMVRSAHQVFNRFAAEAPVFIAAINGHALGGGYEIALACDIRVAAEGRYRIGLPEVTLGLLPGTGRAVTPDEAYRLGMVDRLVPAEDLVKTVDELATTLASGAPLAIAAIKRAVWAGAGVPLAEGLQHELQQLAPLFSTHDAHEGMTAFTEKRAPRYEGR